MVLSANVFAVDIGSDTSVDRFNTQQVLDDGDRIAGFAGLNAGFQLFNSTVTGLFDCFFPVSGDIALNGGTLNLNQDLILENDAQIVSIGNINGNQHAFHLSPSATEIPSGGISDCDISFLTETADLGPNIFSIDWSYDDQFIGVGMDNGGGDDVRVFKFDGLTLTQVASDPLENIEVNSVSWHPSEYYLAIARDNAAVGPELIVYEFNGVNTLTQTYTVEIGANGDAVAFHPSGDYLAFTNDANANEIFIYPFNKSNGTLDEAGAVIENLAPNKNPDFDSISWSVDGNYLAVGTRGGPGGSSELYVFEVTFDPLGISQNANQEFGRVRDVSFNKNPDYGDILATVGNETPELRLFQHFPNVPGGGDPGSLTQVYGQGLIVQGRAVDWAPTGGCLAVGTQSNPAAGEFFTAQFDPLRTNTLFIDDTFEIGTLTRTVRWARSGKYVANGSNDDTVKVYSQDEAFKSVIFSNLRFFLKNNLTLKDCSITFTGDNILNGQGNCLTFMPTCTLRVAENASILIQDIRIEGFRDSKITMLDSTSTVSFKDVVLVHDADYSFTQGRFDVIRGLTLEGEEKTFNYESDQVSTIISTGIMTVGPNFTFKYNPSLPSRSLLKLATTTSTMILQSAIVDTSNIGLQLLTGTLKIDGRTQFINTGANSSEAIEFGDGIDAANNVCVEWLPAAKLEITGQFVNNNIP